MSVLLALLGSALWGGSDFLGGLLSRRLPALTVVGVSAALALAALVPVALVTGGLRADRDYLLPSVLAGAVGLMALAAFYRALAVGTMGVVAPVAGLGAAVPVVAGLVAGEAPSALQLVGIAVALVGVVLAGGPERSSGAGLRPVLLALAAALGFGCVLVLVAEGADSSVVMTLLVMRLTSVTLLTAVLVVAVQRRARSQAGPGMRVGSGGAGTDVAGGAGTDVAGGAGSAAAGGAGSAAVGSAASGSGGAVGVVRFLGVQRRDRWPLAVVAAADVSANGAFALATLTAGALVSVTGVLASLYPVVTVLLARQILHERLAAVQVAGSVAALAGVVLLAVG